MRRVVVTGVGLVTPLGVGNEATWRALVSGKSGIGPITRFDASAHATRFAGEVKGFRAEEYVSDPKEIKKMDAFTHYALAATRFAFEESGFTVTAENAERVAVYVGVGLGGLATLEAQVDVLRTKGPSRVSPFFIPTMIANMAAGRISMAFGAKGSNLCQVSACSSGAHAVGDASRAVAWGHADAAICGGAEATITPLGVAGFNSMKALSTRNDAPERASRPFDRDRDGFVMAEGSGILLLEELESAKRRGARILAEVAGYGATADAHHITAPAPEGEGAARAMKLALRDAKMNADDVDYINAHGTSTPYNDKFETMAVKSAFGPHARKLAMSSTKSMTGHLLGAAGGVEAAFSALAIARRVLPPTINYENADPECDLDYVPNVAREHRVRAAMSNSLGFGGTNVSLLFREFVG
ncbi:MAG: beta-ketoacyl-ACP synthase II [Deltaproteobacteria bacterium]|nr:beta-ketoacyl-ACP synthase II [Deltaproteobacteria bacterium]